MDFKKAVGFAHSSAFGSSSLFLLKAVEKNPKNKMGKEGKNEIEIKERNVSNSIVDSADNDE